MPDSHDQGSPFRFLAELPVPDAQRLLSALEEGGIRFELGVNDHVTRMNPSTAHRGGTFGRGTMIRILTHYDDEGDVQVIWRKFCGF